MFLSRVCFLLVAACSPGIAMAATITAPTKGSVTSPSTGYTCTVTVSAKAGSTIIYGASVEVRFFHNYTTAIPNWDNVAGALVTGSIPTSKTSTVAIASPVMPKSKGGCVARVTNIVKTGYTLTAPVSSALPWTS
jgi:hypothetical protein